MPWCDTVAILAQGTQWAIVVMQAFYFLPTFESLYSYMMARACSYSMQAWVQVIGEHAGSLLFNQTRGCNLYFRKAKTIRAFSAEIGLVSRIEYSFLWRVYVAWIHPFPLYITNTTATHCAALRSFGHTTQSNLKILWTRFECAATMFNVADGHTASGERRTWSILGWGIAWEGLGFYRLLFSAPNRKDRQSR